MRVFPVELRNFKSMRWGQCSNPFLEDSSAHGLCRCGLGVNLLPTTSRSACRESKAGRGAEAAVRSARFFIQRMTFEARHLGPVKLLATSALRCKGARATFMDRVHENFGPSKLPNIGSQMQQESRDSEPWRLAGLDRFVRPGSLS